MGDACSFKFPVNVKLSHGVSIEPGPPTNVMLTGGRQRDVSRGFPTLPQSVLQYPIAKPTARRNGT